MALLVAVVTPHDRAIGRQAGISGTGADTEPNGPAGSAISPPAAWEDGFPLPAGARRNDLLGGATSVAPGKNYTLKVYDTDSGIKATIAFYEHHLPGAKRITEGQEVRFAGQGGYVKLARLDRGTRITLVIGPH
jgi:hypothetical protein